MLTFSSDVTAINESILESPEVGAQVNKRKSIAGTPGIISLATTSSTDVNRQQEITYWDSPEAKNWYNPSKENPLLKACAIKLQY